MMLEAYKKFWKGYVNFTGRSTRSDYWRVILWHIIVYVVLMILVLMGASRQLLPQSSGTMQLVSQPSGMEGSTSFFASALIIIALVLAVVYLLATILPNLALVVRRLRDANFPWPLIFLGLIPYVGGLVLFILNQFPTKDLG